MEIIIIDNDVVINDKIKLSPSEKKIDVMKDFCWEDWIKYNDQVISFRIKLDGDIKCEGDIYLIVTFTYPVSDDSILKSWVLAPEKLIEGTQKKPEGKVTKRLRQWFFDKTGTYLPMAGEWGNIDVIYDHWNCAGMIFCNYRAGFLSESDWMQYRKRSGF